MRKLKFYEIIYLCAGIFLLLTGLKDFWDIRGVLWNSQTTVGTVVKSETVVMGEAYKSTIEFKAEDGKVYRFITQSLYAVGDTVKVIYQKDNPLNSTTKNFGMWFWPSFKVIMGLLLVPRFIKKMIKT